MSRENDFSTILVMMSVSWQTYPALKPFLLDESISASTLPPPFSPLWASLHLSRLKGMRPNVDGQAQDRTGVVAHERVHRNHLQIQHVLSGAIHGTGENKHCADVVDLLRKQIQNLSL